MRIVTAADLQKLPANVSSAVADIVTSAPDTFLTVNAQPKFKTVSIIFEDKQR